MSWTRKALRPPNPGVVGALAYRRARRRLLRTFAVALAGVFAGPGRTGLDLLREPTTVDLTIDPQDGAARGPDLRKIREFDRSFDDDFLIEPGRFPLLARVADRLDRAQRIIGHGHFNILGWQELFGFGERLSQIGPFVPDEISLMKELFDADARRYGFFGEKVLDRVTAEIDPRSVVKVAGTGHYLMRGASFSLYQQIRSQLGENVVLTSGVRGIVKQMHLFVAKAVSTEGNLSQAARSLAPPGFSFHSMGDFDVGTKELGSENFTERFAETEEYRRLLDLEYVEIRYSESNRYGVRFEPWHIKLASAQT